MMHRSAKLSVRAEVKATTAPSKTAFIATTASALLIQAAPAHAVEGVDSTVDSVITTVKTVGEFAKSALSTIESGVEVVKSGYEAASPYIEKGIALATPYVNQVIEAATPVIKSNLPSVQSIEAAIPPELDTAVSTIVATTKTITPYATKAVETLSTYDSNTLGEIALGAVAFTYLAPAFAGVLSDVTRGYAGEITSTIVLDSLAGDATLVDIRTASEKDTTGLPDLPSSLSGKGVEIEFAVTEDKKLRGSLRDAGAIENKVTALQIAALKRINKGTKIIILDKNGSSARPVAKELARLGFGKVYAVSDGFQGWVSSKLPIKPSATLTSAPAPTFGTVFSRRQLPAPKK